MNRTAAALPALLTLVALLALAPAASAKTVAASPDLVVQKVSKPPATETVGSKVGVVVKVRNAGAAKAGKSKLGLYLGTGSKHQAKDRRLKRVKVKPLDPGKAQRLKLQVVLATAKAGGYRLFACADDTGKLKEEKERNCSATRKIQLLAKAAAPPPSPPSPPGPAGPSGPPPAAAFTMSDGIDWGFVTDAQGEGLEPGDPVTLTLAAGNGIPGQAGYTRSSAPSEDFLDGDVTVLDFSGPGGGLDDDQTTVQLPFAFPFGGVKEESISVSTNGWVSFGSPAWDYWEDVQTTDYRGIPAVVGELERGLMPYWSDLTLADQGSGVGTVKQVVAPDSSWIAFQWNASPLGGGGSPRRTFQLVLYPDGRFRFDYPGENAEGGNNSFVGYSLGTGAASADVVAAGVTAVPPSGLLFTPKALPAAGPSTAGEITALLPKGSSFVSASAGCGLTTAPAGFSTGLVTCSVPSIAAGGQLARTVTFAMPDDAPGESSPANFRLLGSYAAGDLKLTDGDEIDRLSTNLPSTTIDVDLEYTGGNIEAGVPTTFKATIDPAKESLDEPTVSFAITNGALSAIEIDGEPIECTPLGGGSAACVLPSGTRGAEVELTVIPASFGLIELTTTAQALNAPPVTQAIGIAP